MGQSGQRVIKPGGADRPRIAEIVWGASYRVRAPGRDAAIVGAQPECGGQRQCTVIDRGHPDCQVRVRARAVGCRPATAVACRDGDTQPAAWMEAVLDDDFQAERVSLLAVRA